MNLAVNEESRIEDIAHAFLIEYSSLSAEEQVTLFTAVKKLVVNHRNNMIHDCKADLEATEYRLKNLHGGLAQLRDSSEAEVKVRAPYTT
jgi:hypothetical protein